MDWNNVNLTNHERESNLIEGLTFDILLLEINCNIKDINEQTVTEQFEEDLKGRVREARSIFKSNLKNIVKEAKRERAKK